MSRPAGPSRCATRTHQLLKLSFIFLINYSFAGCTSNQLISEQAKARELLAQLEAKSPMPGSPSPLPPTSSLDSSITAVQRQRHQRSEQEIAPGFSILLQSASDKLVNGIFQVNDTGTIRLPYDIILKADGLLIDQFQDQVRNSYRTYLVNPDISTSIVKREYYVNVKGLVEKPGPVLVEANTSLDEVIGKAGGVASASKQGSAPQFVKIEQAGITAMVNLNDYYSGTVTTIPKWQGGETIFLQSEGPRGSPLGSKGTGPQFVSVMGEVKAAGTYPYSADSNFFHYLKGAGGPTAQADLTNVQIIRDVPGGTEMIPFKATSKSGVPEIRQGDTIMLLTSNPDSFRNNIQVYGTIAGILGALAAVAVAVGN
jgi:protein involved in polysaccharide export with SLBB domain